MIEPVAEPLVPLDSYHFNKTMHNLMFENSHEFYKFY